MDSCCTGTSKLCSFPAIFPQSITVLLAASAFRLKPQPVSNATVIAMLERVRLAFAVVRL
jgi:hypothetical protein